MSYLPSSRLYERDPEPAPVPVPTPEPSRARKPATTVVAEDIVTAPPVVETPALAPRPVPTIPVAPPAKEWLVAPPMLHVEAPKIEPEQSADEPETVTVPASRLSDEEQFGRGRQLFRKAQNVVRRHIDRAKNGKPIEGDPDVLWFAVMVAGSLCMGLIIWGAYSALPRFGMHAPLRAAVTTPTLKVTSEVPVHWVHESPPVAPPQAPHIQTHTAPLPPPVTPSPPVHVEPPPTIQAPVHEIPPPVERPLDPLPERKDPAIFVHANLGDTPMIRTWKKLAETSFLLASMTVPTGNLLAQVPDKVQIDYSKQIADLTKAVQNLTDQVNGLKLDDKLNAVKVDVNKKIAEIKINDNETDIKLLANRFTKLEKLVEQLVMNPGVAAVPQAPAAPQAVANLDEIKNKLGNIEQAILKLQPADKRIALSPPTQEPAPKTDKALVVFVNLYNQDLWLWVNQKQHRVPSNSTLTLDSIAVGPATIEVRSPEGIFHRANPTLVANETFTLTAR